jgi:hypothetical protein
MEQQQFITFVIVSFSQQISQTHATTTPTMSCNVRTFYMQEVAES